VVKFEPEKMKKSFSYCLLAVSFLILSCGSPTNPKFISEGLIEYKVTPIDPGNPMAALAPTKMTLKFKDNYCAAQMSAGLGLFGISFISDPEKKRFMHLVKLMNSKYALIFQGDEAITKDVDADPKPIIEKTNDTKIICGYNCKKAIVTYKDTSIAGFDIWYTNEINIQHPNWSTPFHDIDGVLMEYQMKRYKLELRFTCKSVSKAEIDNSTFDLPAEYKVITQAEMEKKFEGF
jgi:GLPGLI family protein